ncbi:MAG: polysaccharide deacetylase family protein [Candidatus Omnitrophica bacterium]|nr:polysaccharide deacetylase family protein [Candidatus Omnitrophota bacterium]MCM8788713.1 polysaccharide deacetylase family protein [Candidatus Omnitrophota bacterium]
MILAYHRINPWYPKDALSVNPEMFESQIKFLLEKGFEPVSLYQYIDEKEKHKKKFCITFDDGFVDNFIFAFPFLKKHGIRATIFITAHFIGTDRLHRNYTDREKDRYLRWKEVQEMLRANIDFGSHSLRHPDLTTLDRKQAWDEIFESKKFIQKNIGRKIDFFCYPYGKQNKKIREMVKNAGYLGAVVTNWKNKPDRYALPRIGIYGHNSFFIFRMKLWLEKIRER